MPELLTDRLGAILQLTLNRPEAYNAMTPSLIESLGAALTDARGDDGVKVIVITGAGERAFCSGSDLRHAPPISSFEDQFAPPPVHLSRGLELWKPVVAAINGYALGGGLELALACDIRLASETATFGLPEVTIGSIPGAGGTQRLIRQIPQAFAMRMLLVGDRIDAEKALSWGLVSDVVPPGDLMSSALDLAEQIARNAPLSVQAAKQAALHGVDLPLRDGIRLERTLFNLLRDSEDRAEGRAAFGEKRPPEFRGR